MGRVLLDAFLDTLKVFPFVLIIYILIAFLENETSLTRSRRLLQGNLAPLLGAATGIIPECGFSVMAARLYDRKLIRTGTLLAVFIATSDEALIILLSDMGTASAVLPVILIKIVAAVAVGYFANFLFRHESRDVTAAEELQSYMVGRERGESAAATYFVHPLLHSLEIALYLLIVNLVFGIIVYMVGEDVVAGWFVGGKYIQPLICAAIGLIPNCASSVIIAGAYVNGGVLFGSMVAGLCANAGLGMVMLFRNGGHLKRNILIVVTLYVVGVAVGICVNVIAGAAGFA